VAINRLNLSGAVTASQTVQTDGNGKFSLTGFIRPFQLYEVKVSSVPASSPYILPGKTVNVGWTWDHIANPVPGTPPGADTPAGSESYFGQMMAYGDDCASEAQDAQGVVRPGRCDFELESVVPGVCGNGLVDDPLEQCDDGNNANGDGCAGNCQWETDVYVCPVLPGEPGYFGSDRSAAGTTEYNTVFQPDMSGFKWECVY
jgi:cysteine-rich repeat protein